MSEVGEAIDEARAAVAEAAADILPDLCTITIPGAAANSGDGTFSDTPTTIDYVPCKYEPLSAYERQINAAQIGGFADYKLTLPFVWEGTPLIVPANASVTVETRGDSPARTFTVSGALYSSMDVWLMVAVKKVEQ